MHSEGSSLARVVSAVRDYSVNEARPKRQRLWMSDYPAGEPEDCAEDDHVLIQRQRLRRYLCYSCGRVGREPGGDAMDLLFVLAETQINTFEDGMDRVCKLTGARHDVNEIAASSDQLSNSLFLRFLGYFAILPFRWSGILLELTLARAQVSSSRACVLYCHGNLRVLDVRCHGVDSTVFGTIGIEPKCRLRRISSIPMQTMEQWDKAHE
jgi:hypothetical protein